MLELHYIVRHSLWLIFCQPIPMPLFKWWKWLRSQMLLTQISEVWTFRSKRSRRRSNCHWRTHNCIRRSVLIHLEVCSSMVHQVLERPCLQRLSQIKRMLQSLEWLARNSYRSISVKDLGWSETSSEWQRRMLLLSSLLTKLTLLPQKDSMLILELIVKSREFL
mgnify:CR=1 FL=1